MRLIDAYALQDEIHKSKMQNPHKDAKTATNHDFEHDHFMQMVVLQPTAQEEIVRCKDCKHGKKHNINIIECMKAHDHNMEHQEFHRKNWFCADGERMDEDA